MHLPPAVSYRVVRSRWHFYLWCALTSLAVAATACYWIQQDALSRSLGLAGIVIVSAVGSFLAWRSSPAGLLHWDGIQWLWPGFGESPVQSVELCLDLQFMVLLQLKSAAGKTIWLFIEESGDDAMWLALRRAIVFSGHGYIDADASTPAAGKTVQ
jgi:hypothetical protein